MTNVELNDFMLIEVAVKSKGGNFDITWGERQIDEEDEAIYPHVKSWLLPRDLNIVLPELVTEFAKYVRQFAGFSENDEIEITKVKFFTTVDGNGHKELYDIDIHCKITNRGDKPAVYNTGRKTISNITLGEPQDYNDLNALIIDIELNTYQFAIEGKRFKPELKKFEIESDGKVQF